MGGPAARLASQVTWLEDGVKTARAPVFRDWTGM